jgi:hypothetical protein
MKVIVLLGFLIVSASCSLAQIGMRSLFGNGNVSCSVNYEIVEWSDSIAYQFIAISVKKPAYVEERDTSSELRFRQNLYYDYMASLYVQRKKCRLYPVFSKTVFMLDSTFTSYEQLTGYFLIDDLKKNLDSLEVTQLHYSGMSLQSSMHKYEVKTKVVFDLPKLAKSKVERATKKWFKKWAIENPDVYNTRREQQKYNGCE